MDAIHVDAKYWENPYIMPISEHSGEDTDQESEVINVQSDGDILLHRVCDGSCSNHGDCRNGVCECFQGHEGSDCSESQVKPPEVSPECIYHAEQVLTLSQWFLNLLPNYN